MHLGRIGTSAQVLHTAVPQLVVPCAYDQFDNALRLQRLGVAKVLSTLAPGLLQARLQALLKSPDVAMACQRWAGQGQALDARNQVCQAVEQLV